MSAHAIREFHGKRLLARHMHAQSNGTHTFDASHSVLLVVPPELLVVAEEEEEEEALWQAWADEVTMKEENAWLLLLENEGSLVVKPDMLLKRRGKAGLVGLQLSWTQVLAWIRSKVQHKQSETSHLTHFLVEPFVPHHPDTDEYYVCISSHRSHDEILFCCQGGIHVGNVDEQAARLLVPVRVRSTNDTDQEDKVEAALTVDQILASTLFQATCSADTPTSSGGVPEHLREALAGFLVTLWTVYRNLNFTYLEINPLVVRMTKDDTNNKAKIQLVPLDLAAKLDTTAAFLCGGDWGAIEFPPALGRMNSPTPGNHPAEAYIRELDSKTGASLKLTLLNPHGHIWTMVAGGGASVVLADTICDYGYASELANYGEYSGAPSTEATYEYAKTLLQCMTTTSNHSDSSTLLKGKKKKIFLIGGAIANFTDVAATFTGLINAIKYYQEDLKAHHVDIWVRRGGPNYQAGLRLMRECALETGLPIHIYGPETHMAAIVPLSLGLIDNNNLMNEDYPEFDDVNTNHKASSQSTKKKKDTAATASSQTTSNQKTQATITSSSEDPTTPLSFVPPTEIDHEADHHVENFTAVTRCVVYGLQQGAVQGMLDFDHMCRRPQPSVAALIFPFASNHLVKLYWGTNEILIPVYQSTREALRKHPEVTVVVNFASFRSVYSSVSEILDMHASQIRTIAIIAEGVPESQTRALIVKAQQVNVGIIGPATVGGIKPGCFRIGNTGGMLDNIVMAKLYRPGSVAYVSRSGGLSNELNHLIAKHSDGVYEGVAIGGDKYPGSRFIDHLLRYNDNPAVHILVLLGEVGGIDEYQVCEALQCGRIHKPLVAWCIGTCAALFPFEVQFGHAGALASATIETAGAKNQALAAAGAHVPATFFEFGTLLQTVYEDLVQQGSLVPAPEPEPPTIPMDWSWAKRLGLVRKPANFISSISDDRGDELTYSGMPISQVFDKDVGVGGVVSLLWFRRQLPDYATKFIEMILMVTADHGPAVSGAHNTIVAARAGKDLVSSLTSGLLTIGPRFGGALDEAALLFTEASDDAQMSAEHFVADMRKQNKLIMGIGHRVKSLTNPDTRVEIIKQYALQHFQDHTVLKFALAVEQVTTQKKANLILNVDGCIAVCFVDLLRSCGAFSTEEADDLIRNGCLNGLFVLGRSIGFIGHYLDQKRLKQGLYRHPWEDISYLSNQDL